MKKLTIKLLKFMMIFAFLITVGCEDVLVEKPKNIISDVTYYNNTAEFNAGVNGILNSIHGFWSSFDFNAHILLCSGDEATSSRPTAPEITCYSEFKVTPTANHLSPVWNALYGAINLSNTLIDKAQKATTQITADEKLKFEAQGRFTRAFSYFWLVRWFGEIPIVTLENVSKPKDIMQSPVADVYKLILEDLTFAEANLPPSWSTGQEARPTLGAAKAMLAQVYIQMTGWPLNDVSKYALAKAKAKEIMDMNRYALEPNMADAFNVDKKYTTKELIFFINSDGVNTNSYYHIAQRPNEEGGWSDITAEPRFFNVFPAGPRKDFTYWTVFVDAAKTKWQNSGTGMPYIGKFRDAGVGARRDQKVQTFNGAAAWPIARYAEILLIYAEASVKADGVVSAAALEAVNMVRRRAGGYDPLVYPDLPSSISANDFYEAVIAERSYELCFEGHRWFDLLRLDRIWQVNNDVFPNMPKNYHYLPKPQTEMDLLPNLKQNTYN